MRLLDRIKKIHNAAYEGLVWHNARETSNITAHNVEEKYEAAE